MIWWWRSCCAGLDAQEESCSSTDIEVHSRLLAKSKATPSSSIDSSASEATAPIRPSVAFRPVLPDLAEPETSVSQNESGLQSGENDVATTATSGLPGRAVSSAMSLRATRQSSLHVEDVLDGLGSSPIARRRIPMRNSQVTLSTEAEQMADAMADGAGSEGAQSVVYSSWFALLSKSIGSDVGSPAWLIGSTKPIEGA